MKGLKLLRLLVRRTAAGVATAATHTRGASLELVPLLARLKRLRAFAFRLRRLLGLIHFLLLLLLLLPFLLVLLVMLEHVLLQVILLAEQQISAGDQ